MPIYEYTCKNCDTTVSEVRPLGESDSHPPCPTCAELMVRSYQFGSVTFKGSGFYKNDQ